jgi:hypothetical protein
MERSRGSFHCSIPRNDACLVSLCLSKELCYDRRKGCIYHGYRGDPMRKRNLPDKQCKQCRILFNRTVSPSGRLESPLEYTNRSFCCHMCYTDHNTGSNNAAYVDGVKRGHSDGYLRDSLDRYIHRVVMEEHIGRPLRNDEHVHHKDGDVTNNDISNLRILSNSKHRKLHCKTQKRRKTNGRFC